MNTAPANGQFALVIPTLNEAGNMPALLDRVQIALARVDLDYQLLIVDDDSQDGTADIVNEYSRRDPRIRLLVRKGARGLAGAVIYGWKHTDATFLGVMDADLQHPPETLPELVNALREGNDIAIGSRYAQKHSISNWNACKEMACVLRIRFQDFLWCGANASKAWIYSPTGSKSFWRF